MIGETIGNFKIVSRLGRGGMGEVWLAEQQSVGTKVAIKLLLGESSLDEDDVQRFFNEARAVGRIQHAGIAKIFDVGIHSSGRAYLVMEFLEGETLAQRLVRTGKLSRLELADLGGQIASVLDATHGAGITHRDLKPDNIFIIPDRGLPRGERVKVLDFGVAKLSGTLAPNSPQTYGTLGTPMYMAPEQWGDASKVDWRADLYSFGCLVFEMACRRPPFQCTTVAEACQKHLNETPPLASSISPEVPAELDRLLARLLAKRPDERPQSLTEVAAVFARIGRAGVDGMAATAASSSDFPTSSDVLATAPDRPRSQRSRVPLIVGGVVVVVAAAAIGGFALATSHYLKEAPASSSPSRPTVTSIVDPAPATAPNPPNPADAGGPTISDVLLDARTGGRPFEPVATRVDPTPITIGTVDRDAVMRAIRAHQTQLQSCNPHLAAATKVELLFTVGLDGRASNIRAGAGGNDDTARCAISVIHDLVLPRARGAPVEISFPLSFAAAAATAPGDDLPYKLTNAQIGTTLLGAEKQFDACMAEGTADRIKLDVTIAPDGHVKNSGIEGALANSALASCIGGVVRQLVFPASRSEMVITVPITR